MPIVDFRNLDRGEAIRLFEQWADEAGHREGEFLSRWRREHSTEVAEPTFDESLRWVDTQIRWASATPEAADLPLWLVPGDETPWNWSGLEDGALCHLDVDSAYLVDQLCAFAVALLRKEVPTARLVLREDRDQWRHSWALKANLASWTAVQLVEGLLIRRYWNLVPSARMQNDDDLIKRTVQSHVCFAEDARRTADGRWADGTRMTIRERLSRGTLLAVDRADSSTLSLTLDPALSAYEGLIEEFHEALASARGHTSVQVVGDGIILLTAPKQTRTRLNAWAVRWWRPKLPNEPREQLPDADLSLLGPGQWVVECEDHIAHRASKKIDQFVVLLSNLADDIHACRTDREVIEITAAPGHDITAAVMTCWTSTFGQSRLLQLAAEE